MAVCVCSREWIQAFLKAVDGCRPKGVPVRNFAHGCNVGSARLRDLPDFICVYPFSSISHSVGRKNLQQLSNVSMSPSLCSWLRASAGFICFVGCSSSWCCTRGPRPTSFGCSDSCHDTCANFEEAVTCGCSTACRHT